MDVAVLAEAAGVLGIVGVAHVDHVKAAAARARTDAVHEARVLVADDVVTVAEFGVVSRFGELAGWFARCHISQLSQIENLVETTIDYD